MRWLAVTAVLLSLPGCADDAGTDPCAGLPTTGVVSQVNGNDVTIQQADGEPAVLHLADTDIHVRGEDTCDEAVPGDIGIGDSVEFEVDAWAESYPVQGWPERLVVVPA